MVCFPACILMVLAARDVAEYHLSFLDLDWANENAINYDCDQCGDLFWFYPLD